MKFVDISPVHRKYNRQEKENYRLVSVLQTLPKIFEKCPCYQTYDSFDHILSKYQAGVRKEIEWSVLTDSNIWKMEKASWNRGRVWETVAHCA